MSSTNALRASWAGNSVENRPASLVSFFCFFVGAGLGTLRAIMGRKPSLGPRVIRSSQGGHPLLKSSRPSFTNIHRRLSREVGNFRSLFWCFGKHLEVNLSLYQGLQFMPKGIRSSGHFLSAMVPLAPRRPPASLVCFSVARRPRSQAQPDSSEGWVKAGALRSRLSPGMGSEGSFAFVAGYDSIIWAYPTTYLPIRLLVDIWVDSNLRLLQIKLPQIFVFMSLYACVLSFG